MEKVSVLVVDKGIDHRGILANASFVLGLTAGRELEGDTFGTEVVDGDGSSHKYLTKIGHFVRKAGQSKLKNLRDELVANEDVMVVDYPEEAAPADYDQYSADLASRKGEEITYRAVYFYGPKDLIVPKTKNLSALG